MLPVTCNSFSSVTQEKDEDILFVAICIHHALVKTAIINLDDLLVSSEPLNYHCFTNAIKMF